jgi:hypothetical protein
MFDQTYKWFVWLVVCNFEEKKLSGFLPNKASAAEMSIIICIMVVIKV